MADNPSLRVMSYNLRFPSTSDGPNCWPERQFAMSEFLISQAPDIIGVQEAMAEQLDFLVDELGSYAYVGEGRKGGSADEHCAIFYDTDVWSAQEDGTFWLSDSPSQVGSNDWDTDHPRVVTWVRLHRESSAQEVVAINTHFSLRAEAREKSAIALSEFRHKYHSIPTVITGDFNDRPQNSAYSILVDGTDWFDAWDSADKKFGPAVTFHGWIDWDADSERRIDWILCNKPWRVLSATT
ncbi:MAG: endonuclease/exonuclease/phosphatase family protein, partial [Candidatus Latescibacteria bacterium]|nr:endonuclease/exonuclease/phosphatase family protein [Candidatus Latescibacterota bacterium]